MIVIISINYNTIHKINQKDKCLLQNVKWYFHFQSASPTAKCLCEYLLSIWMLDTIYWNQQISIERQVSGSEAWCGQC